MPNKLKPCPFCGCAEITVYTNERDYNVVQCFKCGANVQNFNGLPYAQWERRTCNSDSINRIYADLFQISQKMNNGESISSNEIWAVMEQVRSLD